MTTIDTSQQTPQPQAQRPQTQGMKILLIILGVAVGLSVICAVISLASITLLGAVVGSAAVLSTEKDPAAVGAIAADIADFTPPPGYQSQYGMQLWGFSLVAYDPGDGHSHLILMQVPERFGLDRTALEQQMRRMSRPQDRYGQNEPQIVDQKQVQIRGQEVTLLTGEGVNHDGQPYREVSAIFQGKGGPALVVFETPVASWDQATVDAFLASIH